MRHVPRYPLARNRIGRRSDQPAAVTTRSSTVNNVSLRCRTTKTISAPIPTPIARTIATAVNSSLITGIVWHTSSYSYHPERMAAESFISEPRVLIADDDQSIRHLLCTIVEREHLAVDCVSDGLRAIEMLEQHEYSLILLD